MGTTAQKLEYLGTTKSQLKDMINYGLPSEEQITSSTTFRNYVSSIFNAFLEALRTPDTLFTNLPKKSGTGANITLNDTANAPMRIMLNASELIQDGTPTPSSPQDIHTISGSNKVVVCGKNLAYTGWAEDFVSRINDNTKATLTTQDGRKCLWFTAGAGYGEYDSKYIFKTNWKANTQYTISYYGYGAPGYLNACIYYTDGTFTGISGTPITSWSKVVLTSTAGKTIKDFRGYWAGGNSYIDLDTFMVYEGTASNFEPYISQEADIDLSSKNLFYIKNYSKSGWNITIENPLKGMSAGDYTISCQNNSEVDTAIGFSNVVGNVDSGYYFTGYNFGLTKTEITKSLTQEQLDANYMVFQPNNSSFNKQVLEYMQIMINKGSTAISYVPYFEPIEYCKIGNYKDRIFKNISTDKDYDSSRTEGAWYIKKNIGKVILDGTESWSGGTSGSVSTNYTYVYTSTYDNLIKASFYEAKCNKLNNLGTWMGINTQVNTDTIAIGDPGSSRIRIMVLTSRLSEQTTTGFKNWLNAELPEVYYVLATPTYTQITGTLANQLENVYQKMLSYKGTTNISQVNNDLSFNLSVSAIEEL